MFKRTLNTCSGVTGQVRIIMHSQGLEAVVRAAAKAHSLVKKQTEKKYYFYVCGTPASCLFRNESAVTLICSVVPFLSFCLLSFKMENGSRRG